MTVRKLSILCLLATMMAACGGSDESGSTGEAVSEAISAPADYVGAVAQAGRKSETVLALTQIQRAIQTYQAEEGKLPFNMDELVESGHLVRLPELPSGMKLSYDRSTGEVDIIAKDQ